VNCEPTKLEAPPQDPKVDEMVQNPLHSPTRTALANRIAPMRSGIPLNRPTETPPWLVTGDATAKPGNTRAKRKLRRENRGGGRGGLKRG